MTVAQVVLLVSGILVLEALIWIPLVVWAKRRCVRLAESIRESVAVSGERFLIEPEPALFRGSSAHYGAVKGNCVIALTDRNVIFQKLVGGEMTRIPTADIADVTQNKWFLRSYRNGREHLILTLEDGTQVGFMVEDHALWMRMLSGIAPQ